MTSSVMILSEGRILKDDELNIVLLKLVDYLGHPNPVISSVAFNEVNYWLLLESRLLIGCRF